MNKSQWSHLKQQLQAYPGQYECHLTVDLGLRDSTQLQAFEQCCQDLNAKSIVIQLDNGATPTQPMLCHFFNDEPENVLSAIHTLADAVQQQFNLVRLKVEAGIHNSNIPKTDADMNGLSQSCYFEHHLKMLLHPNTDLESLRLDLADYDGHLSRNAFSRADDITGLESRFVTQRFWRGNEHAQQQLNRLLHFLEQQQIKVDKVIREFNIFDSHKDLDAGWISS